MIQWKYSGGIENLTTESRKAGKIGFPEVCRVLVSDPVLSAEEIRGLLSGAAAKLKLRRDHSLVDDLYAAGTLFLSCLLVEPGDVAEAARQDRPDVIALSFLSVTAYPALRRLARTVKAANPGIPIIVGGAFASINPTQILADCPFIDHVGVGEGEELLLDDVACVGTSFPRFFEILDALSAGGAR